MVPASMAAAVMAACCRVLPARSQAQTHRARAGMVQPPARVKARAKDTFFRRRMGTAAQVAVLRVSVPPLRLPYR